MQIAQRFTLRRISIRSLFLVMTLAASVLALATIQPWKDPRFRPAATREYNHYCEVLVAEYNSGETPSPNFGTYVSITQDNKLRWMGMGADSWVYEYRESPEYAHGVYDRTFGNYHQRNDELILAPAFESEFLPRTLHVVNWGDRRYLLTESEIASFHKAVEAGEEPRDTIYGNFMLRHGDEHKTVSGLPELPRLDSECSAGEGGLQIIEPK